MIVLTPPGVAPLEPALILLLALLLDALLGAGTNVRAWLRNLLARVNARTAEHGTQFTVNIGFTHRGLKVLGLSQRSLDSFPPAFQAGPRPEGGFAVRVMLPSEPAGSTG